MLIFRNAFYSKDFFTYLQSSNHSVNIHSHEWPNSIRNVVSTVSKCSKTRSHNLQFLKKQVHSFLRECLFDDYISVELVIFEDAVVKILNLVCKSS